MYLANPTPDCHSHYFVYRVNFYCAFDQPAILTTVILIGIIVCITLTICLFIKSKEKVFNMKNTTSNVINYSETYSLLSLRIVQLAQGLSTMMMLIMVLTGLEYALYN